MGEGKADLRPAREIEREIEGLRARLDRTLAELDRRRRELTDVKAQVRQHPAALGAAGGVLALTAAGVFMLVMRVQERRSRPIQRARRFRTAVERAVEKPNRVAREPAIWEKILAAVGAAVAVALTKRLMERAFSAKPA
jgi:hypothetical protein